MTPRIKICGLTRVQDIEAANRLHLDYIGFVFAPGSRRYLAPVQARALKERLDPAIQAVGVFVDAPPEQAAALLNAGIIDIAQLHGREDDACIARLRTLTAAPIWQAVRVETAADIARANASPADRILLDHGPGGTGRTFDWTLLRGIARPYLLAGGLTPANVRAALARTAPCAVDVSSGCETGGVKDEEKMRAFVEAVRGGPAPQDTPSIEF